ncbi:uncharacterized protein [Periplaneta americana]|uniref:uncharacterized protein isoform X4 n=1 Tax=Periplaneta americana TaxID=6978 RepID=UPI0037E9C324
MRLRIRHRLPDICLMFEENLIKTQPDEKCVIKVEPEFDSEDCPSAPEDDDTLPRMKTERQSPLSHIKRESLEEVNVLKLEPAAHEEAFGLSSWTEEREPEFAAVTLPSIKMEAEDSWLLKKELKEEVTSEDDVPQERCQ